MSALANFFGIGNGLAQGQGNQSQLGPAQNWVLGQIEPHQQGRFNDLLKLPSRPTCRRAEDASVRAAEAKASADLLQTISRAQLAEAQAVARGMQIYLQHGQQMQQISAGVAKAQGAAQVAIARTNGQQRINDRTTEAQVGIYSGAREPAFSL